MAREHIDPELIALLERHGADYSIEHGAKHLKLRVNGKIVLVFSRRFHQYGLRDRVNARAILRRALKQQGEANV